MSKLLASKSLIFENSDGLFVNILHFGFKPSGKSFIKSKNDKGHKTGPCGTPARILIYFDVSPFRRTRC